MFVTVLSLFDMFYEKLYQTRQDKSFILPSIQVIQKGEKQIPNKVSPFPNDKF